MQGNENVNAHFNSKCKTLNEFKVQFKLQCKAGPGKAFSWFQVS